MNVIANGRQVRLHDGALTELLAELGAPEQGVAVAVDGKVVARGDWPNTRLSEGANVEVLTAVQGG